MISQVRTGTKGFHTQGLLFQDQKHRVNQFEILSEVVQLSMLE